MPHRLEDATRAVEPRFRKLGASARAQVLRPRSHSKFNAMLPSLLRISITSAVPRMLMLVALFILLLVAALGLLIGASRRLVLGLAGSTVVLVAYIAGRADLPMSSTIQVSAFDACVALSIAL